MLKSLGPRLGLLIQSLCNRTRIQSTPSICTTSVICIHLELTRVYIIVKIMLPRLLPFPGFGCGRSVFAPSLAASKVLQGERFLQLDLLTAEAISFQSCSVQQAAEKTLSLKSSNESSLILGFSYGGYIALEVLRQAIQTRQRKKLRALILMDTRCVPDESEAERQGRLELLALAEGRDENFEEAVRLSCGNSSLAHLLDDQARHDSSSSARREQLHRALQHQCREVALKEVGQQAFCNQLRGVMSRGDTTGALRTLSCKSQPGGRAEEPEENWSDLPVLIVCGREDRTTSLERHEEMFDLVTGREMSWNNGAVDGGEESRGLRRMEVVEEAGHMLPLEKPEELARILDRFLWDAGIIV